MESVVIQESSQEIALLRDKMFCFSKTESERIYTMKEGKVYFRKLLTIRSKRITNIRCITKWLKSLIQESHRHIQVNRASKSCCDCISTKGKSTCCSSNRWRKVTIISVTDLYGKEFNNCCSTWISI